MKVLFKNSMRDQNNQRFGRNGRFLSSERSLNLTTDFPGEDDNDTDDPVDPDEL